MAFDGTEQLTPFADLLNSVVDAANAKVQAGVTPVDIVATNTIATANVVFATAYSTPPIVVVSAKTGSPHQRFAAASVITETGFTITALTTQGTSDMTVNWIAYGS